MFTGTARDWRAGQRISVRGDLWTLVERTEFQDCESLRLCGAAVSNAGIVRTILTPFDRPVPLERPSSVRIVRPRRWLRQLRRMALEAHPFGALRGAVRSRIDFLPYQMEPALAVLRHGVTRVMIADAVGLGKTIQAGLILNELATQRESFRALIVAPAGLRDQWSGELAGRFGLRTTVADAAWLVRIGRDIPPDVNPWVLGGIYVSSFDFIKRPEVLRPLEETAWDLLVVDEAHAVASGTARRTAVHAIGVRSRRVVLLTATPHAGDASEFRALCRIGEVNAHGDPVMLFRRSRADVGPHSARRSVLLAVRPSESERGMHRLLEAYTARVCREAALRGDPRARLAAIVLRKRALSSAASLARSARKRLALLAGTTAPPPEFQLRLPLAEEDPLDDEEPDAVLAAPGLADAARERDWLTAVAEAAAHAAAAESKTRFLLRLLRRVREPVIVFTEYRDTLDRLHSALSNAHHKVLVLHGGLPPSERSAIQMAFNHGGSLLLATDAASEGLNLHGRCRVVVHYELPWSPSRLEQRTGRVDRIGQHRVVHEIVLIAEDTAERLVLAPLTRRAARARTRLIGPTRLLALFSESRITAAVMDGHAIADAEPGGEECEDTRVVGAPADLGQEAAAEACRLYQYRKWTDGATERRIESPAATVLRCRKGHIQPGFTCVFTVSLVAGDGALAHSELVALHVSVQLSRATRTAADARRRIHLFIASRSEELHGRLLDAMAVPLARIEAQCAAALAALQQRERLIAGRAPLAARVLVQPGLFDQRAVRANSARLRAAGELLDAAQHQLESLAAASRLKRVIDLRAILVTTGRGGW